MFKYLSRIGTTAVMVLGLAAGSGTARADTILNFSDVSPGTLFVFNPYQSQGFTLTSSSGGFVFNSPDTGNGSPQTPGSNPFFAGANGLAAFSPATITLTQTNGNPFSLSRSTWRGISNLIRPRRSRSRGRLSAAAQSWKRSP